MYYRYFLRLAYNGSGFSGWQFQPGIISVQGELEKVLRAMLKEQTNVMGCGRTDAGVHASKFYAHIDSVREDLHTDETFLFRLNKSLPPTIAVDRIYKMPENAHARYSAVSRSYEYFITWKKNAISPGLAWEIHDDLNMQAMKEAAEIILHHDDFISFSKTGSDMKTSICKITESQWAERDGQLVYRITSNRFLRNMVRMIVGNMVEAGKGNIQPQRIKEMLDAKKQPAVMNAAPANGLFLSDITYKPEFHLD